MITRINWNNGFWIAQLLVNGAREEAVARSYVDLLALCTRISMRANNGIAA